MLTNVFVNVRQPLEMILSHGVLLIFRICIRVVNLMNQAEIDRCYLPDVPEMALAKQKPAKMEFSMTAQVWERMGNITNGFKNVNLVG